MDSRESQSNDQQQPIEVKSVKEILEPTASVETRASAESALDELKTQGSDSSPVIDPEGMLVGKVSKLQITRGVGGRGHDPKTSPVEPEVEQEGAAFCYENEPIAKAKEVMEAAKVDEISIVSEEKKLLGKATRDAIEKEKTDRN